MLLSSMKLDGGSPIVGEGLRTQFTGRNRVAYERARMERLSYEFPSYYAERLSLYQWYTRS